MPTAPGVGLTRRLLGEVLRFLAVGGLATAVSLIGFNALVHGTLVHAAPMHDQPLAAYVLVNVLAGAVAYVGMRLWAFGQRETADPMESLVRFFVLGAATMLIPVACLAVSRYVLGLSGALADNISANVIGLGLSTVARFFAFRRYVFLDVTPPVVEPRGA
ncbi:GtrA family protein [Nocardioides conyzicola]|uniref:GtrA family protein n=1 Tax=Nocardioides conyzicola TaxID=1651781 RepID=A0ABP8XQI3_9ACTN